MTQYPTNPQDPNTPTPYDPYGNFQAVPTPSKPGSIAVLAVLAIVIGGLFSLCSGFGTIAGFIQLAGVSLVSGPAAQFKLSPTMQAVGVFISVLELALSITLLMIGIGALSLKPWAQRAATSWWSLVMIVWAIVRVIIYFAWIGPASLVLAKQMQQPNPSLSPQQMQSIMNAAIIGQGILVLLLQLLMPILFLTLWRRPSVAAAFERASGPGTGNPYQM